jgi:uncharacterized protein YbbC (DUF1343 family)
VTPERWADRRVVLLTNSAACRGGVGVRELVEGAGPAGLVRLVPEHGASVDRDPGEEDVADGSEVPWYFRGRPPTPQLPAAEDYVFDLPLVGARCFTYLDGLRRLGVLAARAGRPVTVLDRPNPLGGRVEGPGVAPGWESEVACLDLPLRYGMSAGEVAAWMAERLGWPEPEVVPWEGPSPWGGAMTPPSPNLRSLAALRLYPALVLLEATAVSEGRGTATPFGWLGAPGLDAEAVAAAVTPPAGVTWRVEARTPTASKWAGREVAGLALEGCAPEDEPVLGFGVALLRELAVHVPGGLGMRPGPSGRYFMDLLWGSPALRECLERGDDPAQLLEERQT